MSVSCDFVSLAVPGVQGLHPYQPGKPVEELQRELGLERISKLASNENPLGPSPKAMAAMRECLPQVARYPDGSGHALKAALSQHHGISADRITLGNGSNDVLDLIARAYLGPGREAVFSRYAFAVYPIATQAVGAEAVVVDAHPPEHAMPLGHDLQGMLAAVGEATRVVFIANPNNPTGTWLEAPALREFLCAVPATVLVVLDEAYLEYVQRLDFPDGSKWLDEFPNLIITRTFSKIHGLAGLRMGYSLSSPEVADVLNRVRQPFNGNSLALAAAEASLQDKEHVQRTANVNALGMEQLSKGFASLGLSHLPSAGNFLCVNLGQPADTVFQGLLQQGVIVRPVANYGLENFLRVSIGTAEENTHCLETLSRVLAS